MTTRRLAIVVVLATLAALVLRAWGITGQVVIDDEWHALHKLQSAGWGGIFKSFGSSDHSIPLTLFYKAMAETIGLAEGRLRLLQVLAGTATVPVAAWLCWRATRDAPASALLAAFIAFAPFLVMWSRFARPYALTPLLALASVAAIWGWRGSRDKRLAILAAGCGALLAWLHPLMGLYPAIACIFVFVEDALARRQRPQAWKQSFGLGVGVAALMAVLLALPLLHDADALAEKSGGHYPGWAAYERMLSVFWGGLPYGLQWVGMAFAVLGAVMLLRRDRRLAVLLLLLAAVPTAVVNIIGAVYVYQGQNLGRYILPAQLILFFFGSVGVAGVARRIGGERAAWAASLLIAIGYVVAVPTIKQVATLGPWYGHLDYHWDYRYRDNRAKRDDPAFSLPPFYAKLSALPGDSAPLVEAPFIHEAPRNSLAYYATYHRQPETFGSLQGVCRDPPAWGEPPELDRRFRFRKFVHLRDVSAVKRTGARYLVFHRQLLDGPPFPESERCLARLRQLYGNPMEIDERTAVFDLARVAIPPPG